MTFLFHCTITAVRVNVRCFTVIDYNIIFIIIIIITCKVYFNLIVMYSLLDMVGLRIVISIDDVKRIMSYNLTNL